MASHQTTVRPAGSPKHGFQEVYEQSPIKPSIVYGGERALKEPLHATSNLTESDGQSTSQSKTRHHNNKISNVTKLYYNKVSDQASDSGERSSISPLKDKRATQLGGSLVKQQASQNGGDDFFHAVS